MLRFYWDLVDVYPLLNNPVFSNLVLSTEFRTERNLLRIIAGLEKLMLTDSETIVCDRNNVFGGIRGAIIDPETNTVKIICTDGRIKEIDVEPKEPTLTTATILSVMLEKRIIETNREIQRLRAYVTELEDMISELIGTVGLMSSLVDPEKLSELEREYLYDEYFDVPKENINAEALKKLGITWEDYVDALYLYERNMEEIIDPYIERVIYYSLVELPNGRHIPLPIVLQKLVGYEEIIKIPISQRIRDHTFYPSGFFKCECEPEDPSVYEEKIELFTKLIEEGRYNKMAIILADPDDTESIPCWEFCDDYYYEDDP